MLREIKIGNDKVITFKDISEAFNSELNKGSAGATIAGLSYKDGKVNLYIKPDTQLTNLKISDYIARELKIKPHRSNTGESIDIFFPQYAEYLFDLRASKITYVYR